MIPVKHISKSNKYQNGVSTSLYLYIWGLVAVVIIGALAAAATKTIDGYVLLNNAIYSFIG